MKHKHAYNMLAYAQDAQESDTPWVNWEFDSEKLEGWRRCTTHPEWREFNNYRRRIKTIRIGAYDVPEPLRIAPARGTPYFYPSFGSENNVNDYTFLNDMTDNCVLDRGMMHLSHEAAELHAKALISLTE